MSKFNWVRYAVELLDMHEQTREVLPIAKRHLDQLESDAELGRAVRLAFDEDADGIQFIRRISTVEKLLEWAEGVE